MFDLGSQEQGRDGDTCVPQYDCCQEGGLCATSKTGRSLAIEAHGQAGSPSQNRAQVDINQHAIQRGLRLCALGPHLILYTSS